jgi:hypothetical protein
MINDNKKNINTKKLFGQEQTGTGLATNWSITILA